MMAATSSRVRLGSDAKPFRRGGLNRMVAVAAGRLAEDSADQPDAGHEAPGP